MHTGMAGSSTNTLQEHSASVPKAKHYRRVQHVNKGYLSCVCMSQLQATFWSLSNTCNLMHQSYSLYSSGHLLEYVTLLGPAAIHVHHIALEIRWQLCFDKLNACNKCNYII